MHSVFFYEIIVIVFRNDELLERTYIYIHIFIIIIIDRVRYFVVLYYYTY